MRLSTWPGHHQQGEERSIDQNQSNYCPHSGAFKSGKLGSVEKEFLKQALLLIIINNAHVDCDWLSFLALHGLCWQQLFWKSGQPKLLASFTFPAASSQPAVGRQRGFSGFDQTRKNLENGTAACWPSNCWGSKPCWLKSCCPKEFCCCWKEFDSWKEFCCCCWRAVSWGLGVGPTCWFSIRGSEFKLQSTEAFQSHWFVRTLYLNTTC